MSVGLPEAAVLLLFEPLLSTHDVTVPGEDATPVPLTSVASSHKTQFGNAGGDVNLFICPTARAEYGVGRADFVNNIGTV